MNVDLLKLKIKKLKMPYLIAKLRTELNIKLGYSKKYKIINWNIISNLEYICGNKNLAIISYISNKRNN